ALRDGPEEVHREEDPDDGDSDVDGPLELRVLLRLADAERQREGSGDDDRLPAPEVDVRQAIGEDPRLQETLARVVDGREDRVAGEGEDGRVRVKRAQPAEGELRQAEAEFGANQHQGEPKPYESGYRGPEDRRHDELAGDRIVVGKILCAP